jgi:hypothetical protein
MKFTKVVITDDPILIASSMVSAVSPSRTIFSPCVFNLQVINNVVVSFFFKLKKTDQQSQNKSVTVRRRRCICTVTINLSEP